MPAYGSHVADLLERQPAGARDFTDLGQERRRLFAVCLADYDTINMGFTDLDGGVA